MKEFLLGQIFSSRKLQQKIWFYVGYTMVYFLLYVKQMEKKETKQQSSENQKLQKFLIYFVADVSNIGKLWDVQLPTVSNIKLQKQI